MLDILLKLPEEKPGSKCFIKVIDRADKPIISIIKSVSWRVVGKLNSKAISYFIAGRVSVAL